jgi:hypothetical protein
MLCLNDLAALQTQICDAFCQHVTLSEREDYIIVPLPMTARDGDGLTVYLRRASGGGWRISDLGSTIMRLSYDAKLKDVLSGTRMRLFETILAEAGVEENDGEIFIEIPGDKLIWGIFTVGQAISRIGDLSLWTKSRAESTFQDDLRAQIYSLIDKDRVNEDYIIPNITSAEMYPIDFCIETGARPLYIFGVPNGNKARLATITLQHVEGQGNNFESMIILSSMDDVPKTDIARLMVVANDLVPSLSDSATLSKKINHRIH